MSVKIVLPSQEKISLKKNINPDCQEQFVSAVKQAKKPNSPKLGSASFLEGTPHLGIFTKSL